MMEQRIQRHFFESADLKNQCAQVLAPVIANAISVLVATLTNGGKILVCGNGGSAADAQHFSAELTGRFERERPGLAAIALTTDTSAITAIGNDYSFEAIFSRQVQALGNPGDVLLGISTSGNSKNVIKAIEVAHEQDMIVIGLTGKDGGEIGRMLSEMDVHITVAHDRTARIQEIHILALHCICDGVDNVLFGSGDEY
ncbi:MAG: phosphoheptose isomerase [Saezia sp.]